MKRLLLSINWFERHVKVYKAILYQDLIDLNSLQFYIYVSCEVVS